jgi:hypothetical protein
MKGSGVRVSPSACFAIRFAELVGRILLPFVAAGLRTMWTSSGFM